MAGELLLINPRKRRTHKKRRVHASARRRRRNPIAASNPIRRRLSAKVGTMRRHHRRRRNPISLKGEGVSQMVKNALVAGAGSVAVDAIMGQLRPMLPASVQTGYSYAAAKGAITILLGVLGKKALGRKAVTMAEGALTVQAANLITSFVPSSMTLGGRHRIVGSGMRGLGYGVQAGMMPGSANRQIRSPQVLNGGVGFFTGGGANSVRRREGVAVR